MIRPDGTRIFRATAESWIGRFLLPFLFFGLIIVTAVNATGLNPLWGGLGLLALLVMGMIEYALPMLLNWLNVNKTTLEASLNGRRFRIYWSDVLAAWVVKRGPHPFLCLGTKDGTAVIPLRFFDGKAVWEEVKQLVAPSALEATAYTKLPNYREWAAARERVLKNETPLHVVDHWLIQVIGWGSLAFFITSAIGAWSSGERGSALVLLLPVALSLTLVANWGITTFDGQGVTRRTVIGVWFIGWDEMKRIEVDPLDSRMVLEGGPMIDPAGGSGRGASTGDKRVSISGPAMWLGPGRDEVLNLLQAQTEQRQIVLRRSLWALFKPSTNARVKK